MKIAVEIPDVIYKKLINGEVQFGGITSKNIFNYVKNGTPIKLPEKNELTPVARLKINKILKNIRLDIALKYITKDSDEYDYEAKWMNRGLRIALEVIDKYIAESRKINCKTTKGGVNE